jgi:hypothetical protein
MSTITEMAAEAAEKTASIPRGYIKAELEGARLDAERLGYGLTRTCPACGSPAGLYCPSCRARLS